MSNGDIHDTKRVFTFQYKITKPLLANVNKETAKDLIPGSTVVVRIPGGYEKNPPKEEEHPPAAHKIDVSSTSNDNDDACDVNRGFAVHHKGSLSLPADDETMKNFPPGTKVAACIPGRNEKNPPKVDENPPEAQNIDVSSNENDASVNKGMAGAPTLHAAPTLDTALFDALYDAYNTKWRNRVANKNRTESTEKDKNHGAGPPKDKDHDAEPTKEKDHNAEPTKEKDHNAGPSKDKDRDSVAGKDKDKDRDSVAGKDKDKDRDSLAGKDKDRNSPGDNDRSGKEPGAPAGDTDAPFDLASVKWEIDLLDEHKKSVFQVILLADAFLTSHEENSTAKYDPQVLESLLSAACFYAGNVAVAMSPAEFRATYNIESEFGEEQEKRLLIEYSMCKEL